MPTCRVHHFFYCYGFHTLGGVAVRGLTATAPIGIGNVECPSDATSPLQCRYIVYSSPQLTSPRCLSNFSAAGVRCIQG